MLVEYNEQGNNESPTLRDGKKMTHVQWLHIQTEINDEKTNYRVEHSSCHKKIINSIGTNAIQNNSNTEEKLLTKITEYFKHAFEKKKLCVEYTQASDADKLRMYFGNSPVELGMITTRLHIEERLRFFVYLFMYWCKKSYFDFDSREHPRFVNMIKCTKTQLSLKKDDIFFFFYIHYYTCQKESHLY